MAEHGEELPALPDGLHIPDDLGDLVDPHADDVTPSQSGSVQVITAVDLQPGSPYICEVRPTDDIAISLPRDRAVAYAGAVLTAAMHAAYFAAVRAQMRDVLSGRGRRPAAADAEDSAMWVATQLAEDVPGPDHDATAPLRFEPVLHRRTGEPMVRVSVEGIDQAITGWTPAEARQHARYVLDTAIAADLDTAYRTLAAGSFGAGEQRARAVVADLASYHRPDDGGLSEAEPRAQRLNATPRVPGPRPGTVPTGRRRKGKRR